MEKRTMSRTKRQNKDKTNPHISLYKSIPFYEMLALNTNMWSFMYLLYVNDIVHVVILFASCYANNYRMLYYNHFSEHFEKFYIPW